MMRDGEEVTGDKNGVAGNGAVFYERARAGAARAFLPMPIAPVVTGHLSRVTHLAFSVT